MHWRNQRSAARSSLLVGGILAVASLAVAVSLVTFVFRGDALWFLPLFVLVLLRMGWNAFRILSYAVPTYPVARQRVRALKRAKRVCGDETLSDAAATLRWCAGSGDGPSLIARVTERDEPKPCPYALVGVPNGLEPPASIDCTVVRCADDQVPTRVRLAGLELVVEAKLP